MWGMLAKQALKAGVKKVAKDKLLNRKKKKTKKRASGKEMSDGIMNNEKVQKGGALAVRPTTGLVHTASDFDPVSTSAGESDIVIIRKQVIQVRDILKDTQSAKQAERKNLRKAKQLDEKKKLEDKIEKPKIKPKEAKAGMKVPNVGLGIGNFLTWLAIGVVFAKLKELMPTLKKIFGVLKFVTDFIGNVLNVALGFVVGFIDLAYAGVENLRKLIVGIGGEGAGKLFDRFGTLFTQVMNGALIAAMIGAMIGRGRRRFRKPPDDGRVPQSPKWKKRLNRWFKKTGPGRFLRNQKASILRGVRRFSQSGFGKTLNALRPKNINKFIMEGGVDKLLTGGVKNVRNFVQNIQPLKTIQNLTKDIKLPKIQPLKTIQNLTKDIKLPKIELPKGKPGGPGLFGRIGNRFNQAKDAIGSGWNKTIEFAKNIKWGELPLVKHAKGAFEGITGTMGKWVDEVAKNLDPGKMVQGLIDKVKPNIDEFLGKNPLLKKLSGKIEPKNFVPWIADNFQRFSKQAEPIAQAVKGNKALKSMSNFLGPVDIVVDSLFALVDYAAGGESLVNAVVKALSSSLGFAAGAAAGAALTSTAAFFTAGAGAPLIPFVTFGMGMGGALLGEQLGNLILKALVQIPALADMDDPLAEEMGLSPRKIIRDPWKKGEKDSIASTSGSGNNTTNDLIASADGSGNQAEGLDTQTSYGEGRVVENTTTYIQEVEVPA